jgi:hypothetical protein
MVVSGRNRSFRQKKAPEDPVVMINRLIVLWTASHLNLHDASRS